MRRCGGMVDTRDLKSLVGNNVPVRVRSPAPRQKETNTVPFPPCGENCTMLAPSSFSKSNPLRWASIWFFILFSKSTDFGIGSRSTRPRSGDGGVSRLVPVGDSSPRITNIPHDICVMGDAAFYSTSTTPSSLTVTVMPVLTYSRNSSPELGRRPASSHPSRRLRVSRRMQQENLSAC